MNLATAPNGFLPKYLRWDESEVQAAVGLFQSILTRDVTERLVAHSSKAAPSYFPATGAEIAAEARFLVWPEGR